MSGMTRVMGWAMEEEKKLVKKKKREGGEDVTITLQTNEGQQGKIG